MSDAFSAAGGDNLLRYSLYVNGTTSVFLRIAGDG